MKSCNKICRIRLNPLKTKVLSFGKKKHPIMDCSVKIENIYLKPEKSVKFLDAIFDYKLTFDKNIKAKIHNTQHITSSFYSLKSHQYRIPDKTLINLYKIFIRSSFDYGNASLINAETKYVYKLEQIQMNAL